MSEAEYAAEIESLCKELRRLRRVVRAVLEYGKQQEGCGVCHREFGIAGHGYGCPVPLALAALKAEKRRKK